MQEDPRLNRIVTYVAYMGNQKCMQIFFRNLITANCIEQKHEVRVCFDVGVGDVNMLTAIDSVE
jgi:hypothetical protein